MTHPPLICRSGIFIHRRRLVWADTMRPMDAVGYGRHMKQTTQLVSFITLCDLGHGHGDARRVFGFRQMGMELQQNRVDSLVEIIDKQLG